MTRINVVPVEELSDQCLVSEYRELPRVIKTERVYIGDAPEKYCLSKGHVKWAVLHSLYCLYRYYKLCQEMEYRGFKVNYPYDDLAKLAADKQITLYSKTYIPTPVDVKLNTDRLVEKYKMKPNFYRWTKREKPQYMKI